MISPEFGSDPMDQYSKPLEVRKLRLGTLFTLQPRERADKPGRSLSVVWDNRVPLTEGFDNKYSYFVTFQEKGSVAGNHYHQEKQEIYYPVIGSFTVVLEKPETKEKEVVLLNTNEHTAIFVPKGIAHVVRAESETCVLLVTASSAQVDSDEFAYKLL